MQERRNRNEISHMKNTRAEGRGLNQMSPQGDTCSCLVRFYWPCLSGSLHRNWWGRTRQGYVRTADLQCFSLFIQTLVQVAAWFLVEAREKLSSCSSLWCGKHRCPVPSQPRGCWAKTLSGRETSAGAAEAPGVSLKCRTGQGTNPSCGCIQGFKICFYFSEELNPFKHFCERELCWNICFLAEHMFLLLSVRIRPGTLS